MLADTEIPAPAMTTIFFFFFRAVTSLCRRTSSSAENSGSGLLRSRYSVVRTFGGAATLRFFAGGGLSSTGKSALEGVACSQRGKKTLIYSVFGFRKRESSTSVKGNDWQGLAT
ncbi:hypothetical protein V2G26_014282 [Clonostachys chloroleuca]